MRSIKNFFLILTALFISCQVEPLDESLLNNITNNSTNSEKIEKNSELYTLLENVTNDEGNPTEKIVCLDFIYPFKVLVYDTTSTQIGNVILTSDQQFSLFLENLPLDQKISISYPINTTLEDGEIFSVNNNSELKLAIESCSKEDIINHCNNIFGGEQSICIWKIPYTIENDNKYSSGYFSTNSDGSLEYTYNGTSYTGTWIFLYVDNKLHLNINLEGSSQVTQDWNIDREIELINEDIIIKNELKDIILRKSCQSIIEYQIGDTGPAGGIVFYDKGSYSEGWRYMEAAPLDTNSTEWGCFGTLIENANSTEIGKGLLNSILTTNYHDNLFNYYLNPSICNSANNGTVASREALIFEINNIKDWFLPSEEELTLMYQNLKNENLGSLTDSYYWSSTQVDENNAKAIDFSNGAVITQSKIGITSTKSRVIRYF